jgi:hypothetical protein
VSYFALGGKLTAHRHYAVVTNAIIGDADEERLKEFWTQLSKALPSEGYGRDQKRFDPIETAYQRYSDAGKHAPANQRQSESIAARKENCMRPGGPS